MSTLLATATRTSTGATYTPLRRRSSEFSCHFESDMMHGAWRATVAQKEVEDIRDPTVCPLELGMNCPSMILPFSRLSRPL